MELAMVYASDCTAAIVSPPLECSACGHVTSCLVNRDGRTRCYDCDAHYQDMKLALAEAAAVALGYAWPGS
jgi:hypothetical protein